MSRTKLVGLLIPAVLVAASCEYDPSLVEPVNVQLRECDGQLADIGVGWTNLPALGGPDPASGSVYDGTSGDDVVVVTNGPVTYRGGDGDDLICVNETNVTDGPGGVITIDGGGGNDTIRVYDTSTEVVVTGGTGTDRILGTANTRVVEDLGVRLSEDVRPSNTMFDPADIPAVVDRCLARLGAETCSTMPIFFSANGSQTVISEHIQDAQDAGFPSLLHYEDPTPISRPNWSAAFETSDCAVTVLAKSDCDEYPYFKTAEGWRPGDPAPSLRRVPFSSNRSHGASHGHFLRQCKLDNAAPGPTFAVLPVHDLVPDDVKSFWACGTTTAGIPGTLEGEHDPANPSPNGQPCTVQVVRNANRVTTRVNDIGTNQIFENRTLAAVMWSPDLVDLQNAAHFEIESDRPFGVDEYPLDIVGVFGDLSADPEDVIGPLNMDIVLKDGADVEIGRVACVETADGLDFIVDGTTNFPWQNRPYSTPGPVKGCTHVGTAGDDDIVAGSGDDVICPMAGDDVVDGADGDDFFALYEGADTASGGNGVDFFNTVAGPDPVTIDGGDGDDTAFGNRGDDLIVGGDGNDRLFGDEGNDYVDGEEGNDSRLSGGPGNDVIVGGPGDDRSDDGPSALRREDGDDVYDMGDGNDYVDEDNYGSTGNDIIYLGDNTAVGLLDADTAYGGLGDDLIIGGSGRQALFGGPGNDILEAALEPAGPLSGSWARTDRLEGDEGNDLIRHISPFESLGLFPPAPLIKGGEGNDLVITLDGSFDSVYLAPTGVPIVTIGACSLVVNEVFEPGQSGEIECSFPFFSGLFNVEFSTDETLTVEPAGELGYFLGTFDGLLAGLDAAAFGLDSLTGDACICDPTITTPQGIPILSDNQ